MAICKPTADWLTTNKSSDHNKQLWAMLLICTGSQDWSNISDILLTKILNSNDELASPCKTPVVVLKGWHNPLDSFI